MANIPNSPNTLNHVQCMDILSRIQEACFLELQIIEESPVYVWTNEKPRRSSAAVASRVANIMLEAGLNP